MPGADDEVGSGNSGTLDGTPVFLGYGEDDSHVGEDRIEATAAVFERLDAAVTTRRYPYLGHAVTDDEFDVLRGPLVDAPDGLASEE